MIIKVPNLKMSNYNEYLPNNNDLFLVYSECLKEYNFF